MTAGTVVIIGGGLAGMRAAIEAARSGARVTLVARRISPEGGASRLALGVAAVLGTSPSASIAAHAADTVAGSRSLADPSLVEAFVRDVGTSIAELAALGTRFDKGSDGAPRQVQMPGHSSPRSLGSGMALGLEATRALAAELARRPEIELRDRWSAHRVIVEGDRVVGIAGRSDSTGKGTVIAADAVVLATGGLLDVFRPRAVPMPDLTADGFAMALMAGAELTDMEFTQFFPTALIWPPSAAPVVWVGALRYHFNAHLLDSNGSRFMARYDPEAMELSTRDVLCRAIATEVLEGRGSPHGGVWMSLAHVPAAQLEAFLTTTFPDGFVAQRDLAVASIDLPRDPIEVGPIAHFQMGGICIDAFGRTSVTGLFAAGEVAGGLHGANRIEDNAVGEALVFGARAGAAAARYAAERSRERPTEAEMTYRFAAASDAGPAWVEHERDRVGKILVEALGPVRAGPVLQAAGGTIAALRRRIDHEFPATTIGPPSVEQLRSLLLAGGAMVAAATWRRESRGSHYRVDHPDEGGTSWQIHSVVRDNGTRPI